jgi:hypothetical protein
MKITKDNNGYYYFSGAIYFKSGYTSLWVTTFDNHKTHQYHKSEADAQLHITNELVKCI